VSATIHALPLQSIVRRSTAASWTTSFSANIALPLAKMAKVKLSLEISIAMFAVMAKQHVVREQTAGLLDRTGSIMYQTGEPERFIGLSAPPDVLRQIDGRDEGVFRSTMRAGVSNYAPFSRMTFVWLGARYINSTACSVGASHLLAVPRARSGRRHIAAGGSGWPDDRPHHRQAGQRIVTIDQRTGCGGGSRSTSVDSYSRGRGHRSRPLHGIRLHEAVRRAHQCVQRCGRRYYVPALYTPGTGHRHVDRSSAESRAGSGCHETILAVESNSGPHQVLARQVSSTGYRVLKAHDAQAARDKLESDETIDQLLTDLVHAQRDERT
jgi:hypothetical protein